MNRSIRTRRGMTHGFATMCLFNDRYNRSETNLDQALPALTGRLFSEAGSRGTLDVRQAGTVPDIRQLHCDAVVAFVPLHLACLLLFWIQHDWHYLLWLGATYAIPVLRSPRGLATWPTSALEDQA